MLYAENYVLDDIVMPIKVHVLEKYLRESKYPDHLRHELVDGFTHGFDIGYRGKTERKDTSRNIPLRVGSKVDLWNKVMKEVALGRYAGPYDRIPYDNYIQSPIGLVPKAKNQVRLIFHLSYDFPNGNTSLNANTLHEICMVKYRDLDYAVQTCLNLLKEGEDENDEWMMEELRDMDPKLLQKMQKRTIYYAKTDAKSAFRLVPVKIGHHRWLVMMAEDPMTGHVKYFVDKCLPFGASISCALFQKFSDALKHIAEFKLNKKTERITNYLDNFLFVALMKQICDDMLR